MTKNIIVCGNSFSHGHYLIKDNLHGPIDYETVKVGRNRPYIDFIAKELDIEYLMLAKPISSNYCICKQIEYAITKKPDLVIVNFSTIRHIDITDKLNGKILEKLPTLENFSYAERTFAPAMENPTNSNVEEQIINSLRYTNLRTYTQTTNGEYGLIWEYLFKFNNYFLKADQEKLMILGTLGLLRRNNIKFIIADLIGGDEKLPNLANPTKLSDSNIVGLLNVEPVVTIPSGFREMYPNPTDDFHFNEEGQREVAKLLIPLVKHLLSYK